MLVVFGPFFLAICFDGLAQLYIYLGIESVGIVVCGAIRHFEYNISMRSIVRLCIRSPIPVSRTRTRKAVLGESAAMRAFIEIAGMYGLQLWENTTSRNPYAVRNLFIPYRARGLNSQFLAPLTRAYLARQDLSESLLFMRINSATAKWWRCNGLASIAHIRTVLLIMHRPRKMLRSLGRTRWRLPEISADGVPIAIVGIT